MDDKELIKSVAKKVMGTCKCGCGGELIATRKGRKKEFINGHNMKKKNHYNWKDGNGPMRIKIISHPRADKNGWVLEHILIAESVLGESLPHDAVVHHIDGNKQNNNHNNLIICQNGSYHRFLHERQKALISCGNANWRKCKFCHKYDDPINMAKRGKSHCHKNCESNYYKSRAVCLAALKAVEEK